jgi:GNAT superfamily N-acetyltransferase
MSFALQKYIRKTNKRIILASCHFDIMEWLMPDWTCSPQKNEGSLERGQWLRQGKPQIELQVSRVEYGAWNFFKKHHYLTENVNKSCQFFLFEWNNKPIGIVAMINQPNKGGRASAMGISRVVVLPDFQGMGLGVKICEFTSSIFIDKGASNVYIKTVNPALGMHFEKSDIWKPTSMNGKIGNTDKKAKNRKPRPSYCYEYIGEGISGYEELLKPIKEMREAKSLTLF